jgi:serine protease Do
MAAASAGAPQSFADIVQRVSPAVVSIDVVGKVGPSQTAWQGQGGAPFTFKFGVPGTDNPFGFDFHQLVPQAPGEATPMHGAGSGFFISANGYILTNDHVVKDAEKITVKTKAGRELSARLVGVDPATDLAVIQVQGNDFPFVSFEDRAQPRVGDWVVAVGNPFGLSGTATAGIVSALARKNVSDSNYVDYMQIDAPINRGNSGGPTFDTYGRVVGVNTAIFSPSGGSVGIGFDIPADVAALVSRQLIDHGKVVRGYIGATIQDVTPDIADSLGMARPEGALVAQTSPGGPSDRAGLRMGDLILGIDGHPVSSANDLTRRVALVRPGETISLEIRRDGRLQGISLRSGARPAEATLASNTYDEGGGSQGLGSRNGVLGMQLQPNPNGGVTIEGVDPGSDASEKGLESGDVIVRAGDRPVSAPADIAAAAVQARRAGHKDVLVLVEHGGRKLFVPLQIETAIG